jgi:hypothetical protein
MEVGRRLEVETEVNEERKVIVEPKEGEPMPEASEISRIQFDVHSIDEVRENEIEVRIEVEIEIEAEIAEVVNVADDKEGNDDEISDFLR